MLSVCEDTAEFRQFTYCEQETCERYLAGGAACHDNGTMYMGCVCKDNYVMNAQHVCVPTLECNNCQYNGTVYQACYLRYLKIRHVSSFALQCVHSFYKVIVSLTVSS